MEESLEVFGGAPCLVQVSGRACVSRRPGCVLELRGVLLLGALGGVSWALLGENSSAWGVLAYLCVSRSLSVYTYTSTSTYAYT